MCLKAIAKDPGRRYQSAAAFAAELAAYLNGDPVTVKRRSAIGNVLHWFGHRRRIYQAGVVTAVFAMLSLLLHVMVIVLGFVSWAAGRTDYSLERDLLMVGYIVLIDLPVLYGARQIMRFQIWPAIVLMGVELILFVCGVLVMIWPEKYPLETVHQDQSQVATVWFFVAVFSLMMILVHLTAIYAFRVNRELIRWRTTSRTSGLTEADMSSEA